MKYQELNENKNFQTTETPYDEIKIPEKDQKVPNLTIPSERIEDKNNVKLHLQDDQTIGNEEKKKKKKKKKTKMKNMKQEQKEI